MMLAAICGTLASCAGTPVVIDTSCQSMPKGTISACDTRETKAWMRTYEKNRQSKCLK